MSDREIDYNMLANSGYPTAEFAAGDVIFSEGEDGSEMFIVRSGEVEIVRNEKIVGFVGPREIFGEMALIDGSKRSATARAKVTTEVVAINERGFLFLVTETPYFALNVMRTLANRLRAMNDLI